MIIDAWNIMHAGIPDDTWMKLRLLKSKGYHLTLMSNTNEIHWAHTQSLYRDLLDECFEAIFLSFREHCAKPDEAFFRRVNSAIHAVPDETFFVDDLAVNRDAARNSVRWLPCADMEELMEKII